MSAAVIARSWAEYLANFISDSGQVRHTTIHDTRFSFLLTPPLSSACSSQEVPSYFTKLDVEGVQCNPLSVVIIMACTVVLCLGVKESTKFNAAMTIINLLVLAYVLFAGSPEVTSEGLDPFVPNGVQGVAKGAGLVFFAYLGFDMVACLSEEVKDPQRNMPVGIIGSLVVSMSIYVSLSVVIVGMAPLDILGSLTPISNAFKANGCCTLTQMNADVRDNNDDSYQCLSCKGDDILSSALYYGSKVINFGALFGLTTACFTCQMGQPRIFYRMAKDGLLFSKFGEVDKNTMVPVFGTIMTGIMVSALAFAVDLESLANMIR